MYLYLIRHAQPHRVVSDVVADPALSDTGHRQAHVLGEYLATHGITAVISSPKTRARQTADAVAVATGLPVLVDPALVEWDDSATSYIPFEELKAAKHPSVGAFIRDDSSALGFDAAKFKLAAVSAVESIITRDRGQTVAVVAHSGIINAYLGHVWQTQRLFLHNPDYTGIARLAASSAGIRTVFAINDTTHMNRGNSRMLNDGDVGHA